MYLEAMEEAEDDGTKPYEVEPAGMAGARGDIFREVLFAQWEAFQCEYDHCKRETRTGRTKPIRQVRVTALMRLNYSVRNRTNGDVG